MMNFMLFQEPLNLTLDQLEPDSCRYPTQDSPMFLFCGQPSLASKPYCKTHAAICYRPLEYRRQA